MVCEVTCWRFLTGQLGGPAEVDSDQIETLTENIQHYTMWEIGRHTQNIQTSNVIGENEKYVFYLMVKNMDTFWPTQYFDSNGESFDTL